MRKSVLAPLSLAFMLAASVPAIGQTRHNSDAPIDFGATNLEIDDRAKRARLTGNVRVTQAQMTLTAARATIAYTGDITAGSPQASRLDAAGGVTVTRPDQTASAQYAVYDINRRIITMIGGVTLTQGTNVVRGGRLSINLDTGRATIDGSGVSGGSATPGVQSQGGRVTGRFSEPKRESQPQSPPPGQ